MRERFTNSVSLSYHVCLSSSYDQCQLASPSFLLLSLNIVWFSPHPKGVWIAASWYRSCSPWSSRRLLSSFHLSVERFDLIFLVSCSVIFFPSQVFVLSRQVPFLSLLVFSQVVLVYFLVLYFNKTLQWAMQYHFGSFIMFSFHFRAEVTEIATVSTLFEPLHLNIHSGYFTSFSFLAPNVIAKSLLSLW